MAVISIFVGSVYGGATHVAEQVQAELQHQGNEVTLFEDPTVEDFEAAEALLVLSSTTGQGDIPAELESLYFDLESKFPLMNGKPFGVIGMGDSSYGDTYCGAGEKWFALLEELQGKPVKELLRIDAIETMEPEVEAVPWAADWATQL
ncbi:flavodoxin [Alteromonadaceae bacterium BrNp21-10]|nr:flavodoxin [Alteromonadaceae bacterium BrNp21-10]